ncbi:hypothetical protein FRC0043_01698 [Corynebacterium belfantii]|nr:hypothetical protein FRC0043_01698 [Corynebacterium belfantii]
MFRPIRYLRVCWSGFWGGNLTAHARLQGCCDRVLIVGKLTGHGEKLNLLSGDLRPLIPVGVQVVDEDGLVGQQGDQPADFTDLLAQIIGVC